MTNEHKAGSYMATTDEAQKDKDALAKEGHSKTHSSEEKKGMTPERTPTEKPVAGATK